MQHRQRGMRPRQRWQIVQRVERASMERETVGVSEGVMGGGGVLQD